MSLDSRGVAPQRLLPPSLEDKLIGLLSRLGGLILLAAVCAAWLSLISWSAADPSFTHSTSGAPRNFLGGVGAVVSDLLLQTFGFAAAVALIPPMFWSFDMLASSRLADGRIKAGFYPLAVLAAAGALSSLPTASGWPFHHGFGGILGDALYMLATNIFGYINTQRAGLAASIVLIAAAVTTASKSVGMSRQDFADLCRSLIPRPNGILAASAGSAVTAVSAWRTRRQQRVKPSQETQRHDDAGYDDEAIAPLSLTPDGWPNEQRYEPLHPGEYAGDRDDGRVMPSLSEPMVSWAAERRPPQRREQPVSFVASSGAPFHATHPIPVHSAPVETHDDPHAPSIMAFDDATDEESRAIAQRFAPRPAASHNPPQKPVKPAPAAQAKKASAKPAAKSMASDRVAGAYRRPSLNLLRKVVNTKANPDLAQTALRATARLLEDVLADFSVKGEVRDIRPGPVVTLFELEPARGTKSSRVVNLADDIARQMETTAVRAAVIPGRNAIGVELPNARREPVLLRDILEAEGYRSGAAALPLALGKSIGGEAVVVDLARMPHLLVAGTTGSGKSVGINAMILSLLYRHSPEDCRLLMIDPKMLELSVYDGIPHLLAPVVTDPHKAVGALNWVVAEMEERYKRMSRLSVRNIDVFNNRVRNAKKRGERLSRTVQTGFDGHTGQAIFEKQQMDVEAMPHIVVVVDEFADLMMVAGKEVEAAVQRLAQMARAAGIHLIMATQRPSVDVITGTIKANFPTRISFKVTSKIDSRTILNEQGAEQLLGQGDMLYSAGSGQLTRIHGAFVSDEEVEAIAAGLRQSGDPQYIPELIDMKPGGEHASVIDRGASADDDLYGRAVALVLGDRKASTSYIQRRLSIGYNRAADLIERMENAGLISAANGTGKREILAAAGSANAA